MPRQDFTSPRLFVSSALDGGAEVALDKGQANYLRNVLRLESGATVLAFNGRDGEWRTAFAVRGKSQFVLTGLERTRPQTPSPDILYCFAPLKHARLDYMVQKAVEMGAGTLQPVITRRTQVTRVNLERMGANAIEAAEQCGILSIPVIGDVIKLEALLASWPAGRRMIFCDEDADVADPVQALRDGVLDGGPSALALLIGPEGGFDPAERAQLRALPHAIRLSLGPRILRADTAAVAALAVAQSVLGDWH